MFENNPKASPRPPHKPIPAILSMIEDAGHRKACLSFYEQYFDRFCQEPASVKQHHCWPGGYIDHITEVMNNGVNIMLAVSLEGTTPEYTLDDMIVVTFMHDADKLWRYRLDPEEPWESSVRMLRSNGVEVFDHDNKTSVEFKKDLLRKGEKIDYDRIPYHTYANDKPSFEEGAIVTRICLMHGMPLSDQMLHAICFHHGGWSPYMGPGSSKGRISPLCAMVHAADLISATTQNQPCVSAYKDNPEKELT